MIQKGSYRWFLTLTQNEYEQFVDHLFDEATTIVNSFVLPRNAGVKVFFDSFTYMREHLKKLDKDNPAIRRRLYRLTAKSIRRNIEKNSRYIGGELSYEKLYLELMWAEDNATRVYRLEHYKPKTSYQKQSQQPVNLLDSFTPQQEIRRSSGINSPFPEVDASVERLQQLLVIAKECIITPEDEYFLEEVSATYLPMIIAGANGIRGASEDVQTLGKKNLVEQLAMVAAKMESLIDDASHRALSQVEQQTLVLNATLLDKKANLPLQLVETPKTTLI